MLERYVRLKVLHFFVGSVSLEQYRRTLTELFPNFNDELIILPALPNSLCEDSLVKEVLGYTTVEKLRVLKMTGIIFIEKRDCDNEELDLLHFPSFGPKISIHIKLVHAYESYFTKNSGLLYELGTSTSSTANSIVIVISYSSDELTNVVCYGQKVCKERKNKNYGTTEHCIVSVDHERKKLFSGDYDTMDVQQILSHKVHQIRRPINQITSDLHAYITYSIENETSEQEVQSRLFEQKMKSFWDSISLEKSMPSNLPLLTKLFPFLRERLEVIPSKAVETFSNINPNIIQLLERECLTGLLIPQWDQYCLNLFNIHVAKMEFGTQLHFSGKKVALITEVPYSRYKSLQRCFDDQLKVLLVFITLFSLIFRHLSLLICGVQSNSELDGKKVERFIDGIQAFVIINISKIEKFSEIKRHIDNSRRHKQSRTLRLNQLCASYLLPKLKIVFQSPGQTNYYRFNSQMELSQLSNLFEELVGENQVEHDSLTEHVQQVFTVLIQNYTQKLKSDSDKVKIVLNDCSHESNTEKSLAKFLLDWDKFCEWRIFYLGCSDNREKASFLIDTFNFFSHHNSQGHDRLVQLVKESLLYDIGRLSSANLKG